MDKKEETKKVTIILLIMALVVLGYNSIQISSINKDSVIDDNVDVIPKGMPKIYGNELGVRYDDVSPLNPQLADLTIRKLAVLDDAITLEGKDLGRYIDTLLKISCEYCCGAKSIIFENGEKACGCMHSYAMRGLAKYLITEHGSEFSDDDILEELGKWKTLFFPTQITEKAKLLKEKGVELSYINLASNKYRGIEKNIAGGKNAFDTAMQSGMINERKIIIYKTPLCGCCTGYTNFMQRKDFEVEIIQMQDISEIKKEYGVPEALESCHTAVIGEYFVEGHVPLEAVQKLLDEKPDIDGIALPGMPSGSPGMPGIKQDNFIIYSAKEGRIEEFMRL